MGFSRQEYCSGLPFASPGELPFPGIEPWCPTLLADALPTELCGKAIICSDKVFDNLGSPGGASGKETACQCKRHKKLGSIPGSGRSPGGGHGNPLQCSCLENPMDREAWWATVCGVTKSQTRLKRLSMCAHLVSCSTALSLIRPMSKIGTKPA